MANIKGVEVFAVGKWNGDEYTVDDLDEMVRAYTETSAKVKPSIKLGDSDNQALLQKDGYPSAGWVTSLYRLGDKLKADLSDIPAKVAALIEKRAYRKVSSEVYWNINIEGKVYKRMLSAIALLGEEMPAVTSLDDILAMYGSVVKADRVGAFANAESTHTIKSITLEQSEKDSTEAVMPKTEAEIKLEYDLKTATEKAEAAEKRAVEAEKNAADKAKLEQENAQLKQFKADADKRAADAEAREIETKLDASVTELQSQGLVSPAMKPYVRELLGAEKKEYSIGEKKLDRVTLVTEVLKLHSAAEAINFSEQTKRDSERKDKNDAQSQLEAKVEKYAKEHKVSYGSAYREVLKAEKAGEK